MGQRLVELAVQIRLELPTALDLGGGIDVAIDVGAPGDPGVGFLFRHI